VNTRFAGKVAIVAGSSRGIGLATGRRLATEGASVVLDARHEDELAASVAKLRADGPETTGVAAPESRQMTGQTIHTSAGNVV
jgi:NAD(P)-dependent dehydrogenase (short-subunit alcohol dehydrogenase family)